MAEDRDIQLKDLDPFSYQVFSSYCQKFKIFFPEYTTEQIFKLWLKKKKLDDKIFTGGENEVFCV